MTVESRRAVVAPLWRVAIFTALLAIPSALSITHQSLWLDEAMSCWFADHANGWDFTRFRFLIGVTQMPGYHMLLLGWVRVFGDSERALRSLNLPFAVLFLGSLLVPCRRASGRAWWLPALPFAVFPLLIYYVNECRPYAALLGLSTAAAIAFLEHVRTGRGSAAWVCSMMCLAAFSMHVLGILAVCVLALFAALAPSVRRCLALGRRQWIVPFAVSFPGYVALGMYYLHVNRLGSGTEGSGITAATPGNIASTWKNAVFCVYEAVGFAGLGPPRNDLRISPGIHSFQGYWINILLGVAACASLIVCLARFRRTCRAVDEARRLLFCSGLGLGLLFAVARAAHFGFFGRHGMALVGTMCCGIVLTLSAREVPLPARVLAIAMLTIAWTYSSARLLFVYRYGKDDARSALQAAKERGLPILWNAREYDAAYYGGFDPRESSRPLFTTPLSTGTRHWKRTTSLRVLPRATAEEAVATAGSLPGGRYVFVKGKADAFDESGAWDRAMAHWNPKLLNRLNGFDVWLVTVPSGTQSAGLLGY
jgi:hypothetical protein